jgi:hypothetical protein
MHQDIQYEKITIFLFAILLSSCNKAESQKKVIDLLISPNSELTNISEIATDIEYLPLQTTEKSIIRYILDLKQTQNGLYIRSNTNEVFHFDNSGNYLFKLSRIGRGPEEYESIYDFDVTENGDLCVILTHNRIQFYRITNDGFVYSKALNLKDNPGYIDISPKQNSILLSSGTTGSEPNRHVLIDMYGEIQKSISNKYKYSKSTTAQFVSTYENIIYTSDDQLHFKYWLNDTVFTLTGGNEIVPYMIFNSHGKQATIDALASTGIKDILSNYLTIYSIFETSRYLIYKYYHGGVCVRVYDKLFKKTFFIDYKQRAITKWLTDDLIGGVNIEPKFCVKGNLYSWVEALSFKNNIKREKFINSIVKNPVKKVALQRLAESIDESDNPILIKVILKK